MTHYDPSRFDVRSVAAAKSIILAPEDSTTEHRWVTETPYLAGLIGEHLGLSSHHRVLDYGCGIGRLSKELIHRYACSVVGVDISPSMRALAAAYVDSDRFLATPPGDMLDLGVNDCHHAIAVWVLQHIPDVDAAIAEVRNKLRHFGKLFVVNMSGRSVPMSDRRWMNDNLNVREILCRRFHETEYGTLDPVKTTPMTAEHAFWGVYLRAD